MSKNKGTVSIDQLSDALKRELTLYNRDVIDGIKREAKKSATQLVKDTKATAPVGKRSDHYRDHIKSKKLIENDRSVSYLWYVEGSDYRLSHLLEKGHALKNGGRTRGTHFIQNATDPILEQFEQAVKEIIENG